MEPKAIEGVSKKVSLTKILVTTDFSPGSDRALDYALALARRYDARIYLTHVLAPDPFLYAEPALAEATMRRCGRRRSREWRTFWCPGSSAAFPMKYGWKKETFGRCSPS